jgi:hypothetical protein
VTFLPILSVPETLLSSKGSNSSRSVTLRTLKINSSPEAVIFLCLDKEKTRICVLYMSVIRFPNSVRGRGLSITHAAFAGTLTYNKSLHRLLLCNDVSHYLIEINQRLEFITPAPHPIPTPRNIVTSTCTTSPETSAGDSRSRAGSILPRTALAVAQRVPRCHAHGIIPRNPPSGVLACTLCRDIRAVGIHADIVGAADVAVPVSRLDNLIQEVGGTAVSASVWRGEGMIGLSIGNNRSVGIRTLSPYRQ